MQPLERSLHAGLNDAGAHHLSQAIALLEGEVVVVHEPILSPRAAAPLEEDQTTRACAVYSARMRFIESPAELYAHAMAVEREAAERYAEFAARMQDEGRDDLARLFGMLARAEQEHLEALERRCEGMALPKIVDARYQWLDAYAPETVARELIFRLMTPRHALIIALQAERRALAFFLHVAWTTSDPGVHALANEMAADEREHVALLAKLLGETPAGSLDTTLIFAE
jgi:rubrerythrin